MNKSSITDRLKNLPTRNKPHIFFMHIPKTGGNSTIHALRKRYPFNFFLVNAGDSLRAAKRKHGDNYKNFEQCYDLRESITVYAMEAGFKCIAGHVPYSRKIFEHSENKHLLMTILRDPVQRFIYKYLYNVHKSGDHCSFEMPFLEYLNSGIGRESACEYLRYLSDGYKPGEEPSKQMIEKSKENILRFDIIGFLDDMDQFTLDFQQKTNIKLRIPHKNRTRDLLTEKQTFDPEIIEQIKEVCKHDIEIYQFARQHSQ